MMVNWPRAPRLVNRRDFTGQERYSESELRKALNDNITERKIDAMKSLGTGDPTVL